jgi:glycosyltransferase involved in cell wall biosynthesis
LRILWAQDAFWPDIRGGAERRAYHLVQELAKLGHHVEVLCRKTVSFGHEHEMLGDIPIFRVETPKISDRWWRVRAWLTMRQWQNIYHAFLGNRQYDGAIVFQPEAAYYLRQLRPKMPIVIATGGTWQGSKEYYFARPNASFIYRMTQKFRYWQYRHFELIGNHAADYVVAESHNVHEQLTTWYGLSNLQVPIIGNGVDHELFHPRPELRDRVRDACGLPKDAFLVIGVGRLARVKNFEYLIQSIQIASQNADVHGIIVGSGDQLDTLKHLASQLGVSDRIHFLGHRDDVQEILAASDAFLLPSLSEPYGNAWPEAMATGLPCMGLKRQFSRVNTASDEHIEDQKTGFLLDADHPEECATRLVELAKSPNLTRSLGNAARNASLVRYRWDETAKQYASLIQSKKQGSTGETIL